MIFKFLLLSVTRHVHCHICWPHSCTACRFPVQPLLLSVLSDNNSTHVKAVGKNGYVIRLSAWEGTHTVSSNDIVVSHGRNKSFVSRSPNS